MIELTLVLSLLVPGRTTLNLGGYSSHWLTYTRKPSQCRTYATKKGYRYYLWTGELQPNSKGIHLTGTCTGIRKR